ncbi:outer membrane receptor protein involved in Fe transport [Mucilaginibacter yixingensis]|uniref:Outer membrane receptor protein involved in Fe transport n=1 Tax=Mucilaginibacter yixingensis TaxID=1295612 RepID=A0A2T5JEF6_9SPHI|nr:hypothetical protein [Mucilaginibacter yixingensis]PTR00803.1 outer membrane receptor protein involved in Fe transport [Mucilaginibacter yixingensis]
MKHSTILTILSVFLISLSVKAQTPDSLHYGLGRTLIRKDMTQAITIKGEDLEKLPYNTLSDALSAWLFGVYGTTTTYITNVNGTVLVNADMLSIYDIDQITLVQNSATLVNGISPNQVMLLITTKKYAKGKFGINAAGQTNRVSSNPSMYRPGGSKHDYYSQYYLSAYTNSDRVSVNISADYQRFLPLSLDLSSISRYTEEDKINRYRFNGSLQAKLGKSTLNLMAGYVPQNVDENLQSIYTSSSNLSENKLDGHVWYATGSFTTPLGSKWHNVFNAGLQRNNIGVGYSSVTTGSSQLIQSTYSAVNNQRFVNYLFNDNLSGNLSTGGWSFEPAVNIAYRHAKDDHNVEIRNSDSQGQFSSTSFGYNFQQKGILLTPSLTIGYKDFFNIQGGVETQLSGAGEPIFNYSAKKLFPFALTSVNLGKLAGIDTACLGWHFYASYARTGTFTQDPYAYMLSLPINLPLGTINDLNSSAISAVPVNPYAIFDQWQAGSNFTLINGKMVLSYAFMQRKYLVQQIYFSPDANNNINETGYPVKKWQIHRVGIEYAIVQNSKFSWRSNLNASYITLNMEDLTHTDFAGLISGYSPPGHQITGGFVNRFNVGKVTAGADILYTFYSAPQNDGSKLKSYFFSLSNLYAGYQFSVGKVKHLEVFANGHNIFSKKYYQIDNLSYYGLGFRASI